MRSADVAARLEALPPDARRLVYERLWLELTIIGRAVWSNPEFSEAQKLDGMKWLNEISHRVWGAHQNPSQYAPSDLLDTIKSHIDNNVPYIGGDMAAGIQRAIAGAAKSG